jgi:hypothetical protein
MCLRLFTFRSVSFFSIATLLACGSNSTMGGGAGGNLGASGGAISGGSGGAGGNAAATCHASGTLNVTAPDMTAYVIDGASNPDLTFCRGSTYVFAINAPGHPFYIKSVQGPGTTNAFDSGVTGPNGVTSGTLTFVVPADAPATLYYNCSIHAAMTGAIHIVN